MIDPEATYPKLLFLTTTLNTPVFRIPNGAGTCSDGTNIYLESMYAERIGPSQARTVRTVGFRCFPRAQAIYFLLHEHGHVLQHRDHVVNHVEYETDANKHAARFFRTWCWRNAGISQAGTDRLWRSLPDYYKKPTAV